ncbi:nitrous oxide reductase family maturation protein NosD [Schinkia sp. CFF1]
MRKEALWIIGSALLLLTINPACSFAENKTLQELVDGTPSNGKLLLQDQTYRGNVVITKPITIKGTDKTHIKGDGTGNVILIKEPGHGVHLENLKISHSSLSRNSEEEYSAVKVLSNRNVFRNLKISDSFHGIYLNHSNENEISNVSIEGMGGGEIGGQGNGIQLIYSHRNQLRDTVITNSRDGIYFYYANDNLVEGVCVSHTRYGLHYMYSDSNHFYNNKFQLNTGGAAIMQSKGIELIGNEFSYHQGTKGFGLMLQSSNENLVKNNRFFHNQRGLYADLAQKNEIISNDFYKNNIGVEIWASSAGQVFSLNRFNNNTLPVITIGGQTKNEWSKDGKGNDWGNTIPLFDLNRDKIGDIPVQYKSSMAKLLEDQELVYLFLTSPAIFIYEKINQFLHKEEIVFEDPFPLMRERQMRLQLTWILLIPNMFMIGMLYLQRRKIR